ncbi:MAG: hypothetical protein LBG58_00725, partial [Planctomycetaceae bacterium]|jgi:hypothetical protein|nr:hypothetical protein [Planctomycetaceae bacterium]
VKADQCLKEFSLKIRHGTAVRKDYDLCKNGIEQLEFPEHKQPFYLLLAHYHRAIDREPIKSLEILAPLVVPNDVAEKWIAEQRDAAQKAFEKWSKEFEIAKQAKKKKDEIPKRPEGIFVEFPAMETWKLDDSTAAVCIEIARNFIILNRHEEAFNVTNTVGQHCDKEYKILAAECAADLMSWTKMYSKAVEFYDLALRFFRAIRENGDEFVILTEDEQRIIKNRINYKRGAIYKLAEQGRFTPDWLAYRDAQRKHLDEESLLEAIWMYLDVIKNYPNTLNAEASECYVIKILTMFSNPAFVKEAAKRYSIILDELDEAKAHLRQAKRTAMAQPFLVGFEAYVERLKYVVKMWESTPFGRKALQQAEERAEKFIEKNKYGLYRGEVLLDIGTAHLVSFFDTDNGEKWLNRAAEWYDNVQQFDKDLKDFELPESVRKVSQPPKNERYKDEWTNIRLSQPKPGDFFNRRSCNWYMNSKQKEIVLLLGLIHFANNDIENTKRQWNKLTLLDQEFYQEQKQRGKENLTTYARLIWDLENQKTSFYATSDEMKLFDQPKLRLAVLLADLDMENENYKAAEKKYRGILDMQEVKVRKDRSSYIAYALATSFFMQFKTTEAMNIYMYFAPGGLFEKTISAPRALLNYANYMTQNTNNMNNFEKGVLCYKYLSTQYSETQEGQWALYLLGVGYDQVGRTTDAISTWKKYLQQYPHGGFVAHVKKKLLTYKNILNKIN